MKNLFIRSIEIASVAHKGQTDKNGEPYLAHVMRVGLKGKSYEEKICGILHDVVEDSTWTFDQLIEEGFPPAIIDALVCLTKTSDQENYNEFIDRVKTNPLAIRVKLNDLEDNMDVRRLNSIGDKEVIRLNKYLLAYKSLISL